MPGTPDHNHDLRYYRRAEVDYRFRPDYLLAKIKYVDGPGSGLDADTLDGSHASAFGLLGAANTWTSTNVFAVGGGNVRLSTSYYGPDLYVNTSGGWARQYTLRNDYAGATMRFGFGAYGDSTGAVRGYMGFRNGDENLYLSTLGVSVLSDGNVGIGTTSPEEQLVISKAVASSTYVSKLRLEDTGTVADTHSGIDWYNDTYSWSQGRISVQRQSTANSFDMLFWTTKAGVMTEAMRIDENGYLGIGTASPAYGLHLYQKDFRLQGTVGNVTLNASGAELNFSRAGANYIRATDAAGYFVFHAGAADRGVVASDGRWAFGSTSPTAGYTVTVAGAMDLQSNLYISGGDRNIYLSTGGTLRFLDASSGSNLKVGVGATSNAKLHSAGSISVDGDDGGTAGAVTFTDVTAGVSTGSGTIKMNGATARNSTGWLKIYVGTTAVYLPYFTTITG